LKIAWWKPVLFAALAGGMAWGIRGQYGHETGAMIAGLLVSLTLVFLLCPRAAAGAQVRAVALATVAMGLGGSMTYGQTVGLTHDAPLVGHWAALGWGMLGLAIKGGLWIGLAGAFLGLGLGGVRYRTRETVLLMVALVGAYFMGNALLNQPFDPAAKELPLIYFSDHWHWEPGQALEPRPEHWGGLLFALILLVGYTGVARKDHLARNMALWGVLGGTIGFPAGQSLQAFHAWNPEVFDAGLWAALDSHMNWWNMMETTYGAIMGGVLGLGLWLNRDRIAPAGVHEEDRMPGFVEGLLLLVHLPLLLAVEFVAWRPVDALYDLGLIMAIIPVACIVNGRWWPHWQMLPLTALPIAGKTVRQLVYNAEAIGPVAGWTVYFVLPLALAIAWAEYTGRKAAAGVEGARVIGRTLLLAAWLYFLLNWAFFRFPWPWAEWTGRTPNGIIFTVCVLGLTALVITGLRRRSRTEAKEVGL